MRTTDENLLVLDNPELHVHQSIVYFSDEPTVPGKLSRMIDRNGSRRYVASSTWLLMLNGFVVHGFIVHTWSASRCCFVICRGSLASELVFQAFFIIPIKNHVALSEVLATPFIDRISHVILLNLDENMGVLILILELDADFRFFIRFWQLTFLVAPVLRGLWFWSLHTRNLPPWRRSPQRMLFGLRLGSY